MESLNGAVMPYEDYLRLVEQAEMLEDIQDFDQIKAAVERGEEEVLPGAVVNALLDGENPVKVWREYHGRSRQQLAGAAGISAPYLSQIETGKRKASTTVLAAIADALNVQVDDLL